MIIDDAIALAGSANFTINGLTKNIETEMVIIDPNEIVKLTDSVVFNLFILVL
jgi:phosphatidylserine/phosphatidylglycerophosphate/cardiolipin synthase-like enzyme